MAGWKWYTEINGVDGATATTEFGGTLQFAHLADLSDNPQDRVLYYANIDDDPGDNQIIKQEDQDQPGTNNIVVSLVDQNVGSGPEVSDVTLALSAAALATNTAGASLPLGTQLLSGVTGRVALHLRVENTVTGPGTYTDLQPSITPTADSAV